MTDPGAVPAAPVALAPAGDLHELAALVRRRLRSRGLASPRLDHHSSRTLDPRPLLIEPSSWAALEAATVQRVRLLEAAAGDLYGPRTLLTDGVLPADVVFADPGFAPAAHGWPPAGGRRVTLAAIDFRHDGTLGWVHVADHLTAPTELGRSLENREILTQLLPTDQHRHRVRRLERFQSVLRRALSAQAPAGTASPRVLLLSPGRADAGHPEIAELARALGYTVAEAADLTVRHGRLFLSSLSGLEPVHVLVRFVADRGADPLELPGDGSTTGIAGLTAAARRGSVSVVNALGVGLLESPYLSVWWPAVCRHLLGEELATATVPITAREPAGVTLVVRVFAVHDGSSVTVMPGGLVTEPGRPGRSADVWVPRSDDLPVVELPVRVAGLRQVDLADSLPSRAGEAVFLMGRHLERAEAIIRLCRTVLDRAEHEGLDVVAPWLTDLTAALHRLTGSTPDGGPPLAAVDGALRDTAGWEALPATVSNLLACAGSARELLSVEVWDGLGRLREAVQELSAPEPAGDVGQLRDRLDRMLGDLASVAGVVHESMVRGPAWHLLDAGRRIERAGRLVDLLDTVLHRRPGPVDDEILEAALTTAVSLVAYRRRHRSDLELDAVLAILLLDPSNPRSVRHCLARIVEDLDELPRPGRPTGHDATAGAAAALERHLTALDAAALVDPTAPHRPAPALRPVLHAVTAGLEELTAAVEDVYLRHVAMARLPRDATPAARP